MSYSSASDYIPSGSCAPQFKNSKHRENQSAQQSHSAVVRKRRLFLVRSSLDSPGWKPFCFSNILERSLLASPFHLVTPSIKAMGVPQPARAPIFFISVAMTRFGGAGFFHGEMGSRWRVGVIGVDVLDCGQRRVSTVHIRRQSKATVNKWGPINPATALFD